MNRSIPMVASLLALATFAAPAGAYSIKHTDGGAVVRWRSDRLALHLDQSLRALGRPEEIEEILTNAFETWAASGLVELEIELFEGAAAEPGYAISGENRNDVMAIEHGWPFEANAQAVTIVTYDPYTGDILDADIIFNAERWSWVTRGAQRLDALDLQDVATHEIGHALGLGHSEVPEATMYHASRLGSTDRRTLHVDDLDALGEAYDPSTDAAAAGCSATGPGPAGPAAPLLAAALLLAALRRQRAC